MFPVSDSALRKRVYEDLLLNYLRDDRKSRLLGSDGTYTRAFHPDLSKVSRNGRRFSVQDFFVGVAEGKPELDADGVVRGGNGDLRLNVPGMCKLVRISEAEQKSVCRIS